MKARKWLLNGLMVVVFVSCFALGTTHAQPGVFPVLSDWVDTWFKISLTRTVFHYADVGVKPTPSYQEDKSMGKAFLHITGWNDTTHILSADIFSKDPETGLWVTPPVTIEIQYFAGTALKFIGSANVLTGNPAAGVSMNLLFVFTGQKNKAGNFILGGTTKVSTIASNILEIDDVGPERWVGSAKVSGPMVLKSSVPVFAPVCTTGVDPHFASHWVVCSSDANNAWVSSDSFGQYHPVEICKSIGYAGVSQWGGNYGNVCGYENEVGSSCENPGSAIFSGPLVTGNCGSDEYGEIICNTVQWQCVR
jgi:hypothetical protein